jgi:aminoglycoside phosphotransferase (APT) family kinase protein
MGIDRQQAFSGTAVADIEAAVLEDYLVRHIDGFSGPLTLRRFKGGQSNPSYKLSTPSASYVLRRKPSGKLLPSAHAIEREYEVTRALADGSFPVARPLHLCTDESVAGSSFYLMDFVAGRIFWEPHAPDLEAKDRALIFSSMNDTLARLHAIDYAKAGLSGFGRPDGYVARQIRRWSEQYRTSETEKVEPMDRLMEWLPAACPVVSGASIVHGDYRLDNCIIHPTEPRVIAVLDWELSTLGDPIADFTYHLMQWFMPVSSEGAGVGSLKGHEYDPGIPALADYTAQYASTTSRSHIPHFNFYMAYNFFRLAAILQGIAGRVRDGTSANANAALMGTQVKPLAQTAWAFAKEAGA